MPSITVPSLKQRVLHSGSWALFGHVASQALRFGGNLVLTRLLFPEAFGMMTLVTALMIGALMLTDIGITPGVVRAERGEDPDFLHTAWLLQIGHGVLVALAMCALARPTASHFEQPELRGLVFGAALVPLISGFTSIKMALALRKVQSKPLVVLDIGVQFVGLLLTMALAWWQASVWALVWGQVLGALVRVVVSHLLLGRLRARLFIDRDAVRSILHFGGWVTLSSALTFAAGEGSKLVSGSMLSLKALGLLGLATGLSGMMVQAVHSVVNRSLFPAYAEVYRSGDKHRFARTVERARLAQVAVGGAFSALLVLLGPWLIHLLYDDRYRAAGPMLQILALGQGVGLLLASYTGVLWAMSKVGLSALLLGIQTLITWGCMGAGAALSGEIGVIWGMAAANAASYPVNAFVYRRLGLLSLKIDLPVFIVAAALLAWLLNTL
jgi:O-antigen/teichoic acid export membrane protein